MKILGLIGGMSWESTALYYRLINTQVKQALGGLHSAHLLFYSFDFEEIAALQRTNKWEEATQRMIGAGRALKAAGAQALVICTNTMHKMAAEVEQAVQLPLIHVVDCVGEEIRKQGLTTVGLLATQFTMEQEFYKGRLKDRFGIQVLVPDAADRALVHGIIFNELCQGIIQPESRMQFEAVIGRLKQAGAQGIILGCTEISLLLTGDNHDGLRLFDTTLIHAHYATQYALH